ncbi:9796_t:CDS:2 [Ambispora gerdemannii]|uniref:9796_t:CDS:1 n=1 Tax=Ambispora gerdemannii TaxID=144530 RepID=A0A9N9GAA5_9GLOM|nr:9796_t:CDS:2 [Ambispora gerdemannii]
MATVNCDKASKEDDTCINFDRNKTEFDLIKKLGSIDIHKYFTLTEEIKKATQEVHSLRENNKNLQQSINQFKEQNWYMHYCHAKQSYDTKMQEYSKLHAIYDELLKNHNQIRSVYDQLIKENKELKIVAEKNTIELQNKKETWEQDNKKNQEIIKNLNVEVESLKLEAIQYQSALGNAINVRWDDEDPNNSVNITKDIRKLQDALSDFTFLKGKAYVINKYNIQQLFNIMKTRADVAHKPSVSAALQHLAVKKITKYYSEQMQDRNRIYYSNDNKTLEKRLVSCVDNLAQMVKEFTETREGSDNITGITEIKVRQEIYAMLGNRGFGYKGCRFIYDLKRGLLKTLDNYRSISDKNISKEQEDRAEEIVLSVIRIFSFRLLTQEPSAAFRWFENGEPLNETLMEWVSTGEDETNMVVDICAFPAIGVYLDDPTKWQIYTKAKVQICNSTKKPSNVPQEGIIHMWKTYTNYSIK